MGQFDCLFLGMDSQHPGDLGKSMNVTLILGALFLLLVVIVAGVMWSDKRQGKK